MVASREQDLRGARGLLFLVASLLTPSDFLSPQRHVHGSEQWRHPSARPTAACEPSAPLAARAPSPGEREAASISSPRSLGWLPLPVATRTQERWIPSVSSSCVVPDEVLSWAPHAHFHPPAPPGVAGWAEK